MIDVSECVQHHIIFLVRLSLGNNVVLHRIFKKKKYLRHPLREIRFSYIGAPAASTTALFNPTSECAWFSVYLLCWNPFTSSLHFFVMMAEVTDRAIHLKDHLQNSPVLFCTSVISIPVNRDRYRQWRYMYLPHTPLHTSLYTALRSSLCHILKQML